ncbi:MAG: 16S rRNA (cytosine(1402)-N(4))-methyltransferase RsmH [Syntrophomonadaceae bacterium]|nr:16S rRNA (cytosine(1402)-N(4))-methyltransferase RsmH [Syntrophomonadaceae bacterium]
MGHLPVLLGEAIEQLKIKKDGVYVDCTLGGGGHARAIAERLDETGRLIGIDQDPRAIAEARAGLAGVRPRVDLVTGNFRNLRAYLQRLGVDRVDGVLLDLGVSSFQLDDAERGFSYWEDAGLDMRMDPQTEVSAAHLLNRASEQELTRILREYGEERWAPRIAQFIVRRRQQAPIDSTFQLVEIIKAAVPAAARRKGPHPARRTFQALRIAVNDELGALAEVLAAAIEVLNRGGRLVVISFHSLEDRIVKQKLLKAARPCECPPGLPLCSCGAKPLLKLITKKPVTPSPEEVASNPRSRSARLRAGEKL